MTWIYGEDYDYAATRLEGTFVKHNDRIVYVKKVVGNTTKIMFGGKSEEVCSKDLDTSPIKLGYANIANEFHGGYIAFGMRLPRRRMVQGVCQENLVIRGTGDIFSYMGSLGKPYPTYKECLESNSPSAWHQYWAKDGATLLYKNFKVVGTIVDGVPVLDKNFTYLKESLEESLNEND